MAAKKRNPQTIVPDHSQSGEADVFDNPNYFGQLPASEFSDDTEASLCPCCGELLAWHEEQCSSQLKPEPQPQAEEAEAPSDEPAGLAPSPFAYTLGQPVQPAPDALALPIVWRGQVRERHPRTGLFRRVNVYRLDNGYWDCYYETELQVA